MEVKNQKNLILKEDLKSLADDLKMHFDARFEKAEEHFDEKLGSFAEEVLLPAIDNIVDVSIAKHRHEMKNYIDEKISDSKGDIISYIKQLQSRDDQWKARVTEILVKQQLAKRAKLIINTNINNLNNI